MRPRIKLAYVRNLQMSADFLTARRRDEMEIRYVAGVRHDNLQAAESQTAA